jgi:hypothetical protein
MVNRGHDDALGKQVRGGRTGLGNLGSGGLDDRFGVTGAPRQYTDR